MCDIAGYIGPREAAPILLEMLRREEKWDGWGSTGMALVTEAGLRVERVPGPTEEFERAFDLSGLKGHAGIIHSRPASSEPHESQTPLNRHKRLLRAHPFVDADIRLALVTNGTGRDNSKHPLVKAAAEAENVRLSLQGIPQKLAEDPLELERFSAGSGLRALRIGDMVRRGRTPAQALAESYEGPFIRENVGVMVHADTPDRLYVLRVTRPMVAAVCRDECYIATTRFAFPEDIEPLSVVDLPLGEVVEVYAGRLVYTGIRLAEIPEEVTPALQAEALDRVTAYLREHADRSFYFDELEDYLYRNCRDIWQRPLVESAYVLENSCLKPYAQLLYDSLYTLDRAGQLVYDERETSVGRRYFVTLKEN